MIDEATGTRRVLLKLSGEAFGGGQLGVNPDVVSQIAREIADGAERPVWNAGDYFGTLYKGPMGRAAAAK